MNTNLFTPKYISKKFKTQKEFYNWLNNTTSKIITFKNLNQDLTQMWIAANGEILHCDFQSSIYNGNFINLNNLSILKPLEIFKNGKWRMLNGLIIENILEI